jgi:N-succinyldiaminopimelate aminotransferase
VTGRTPYLNARLQASVSTVFAEMSALAVATDSINLGQGFPDTDGPVQLLDAAVEAIRAGHNQYPPGIGVAPLREAVAAHQARRYGIAVDPDTEVLVTAGATEAIAAAVLALCEVGDEVVMFEPSYDSYAAVTAMAGAVSRPVRLSQPDWVFDPDELRHAVGPRTRMLLFNSPHNPTGKVFSFSELEAIAEICIEHDLLVVTDEVYEHLVYEGDHIPLSTVPGMAERTLTVSSAGKTFSCTGWKIGWAVGPAPLVTATRAAKQFLTYAGGTPLQYAVATVLATLPGVAALVASLRARRDQLCDGLEQIGMRVFRPAATYFATTDVAPLGFEDGEAFCRELPGRCGVVAVPSAVFYHDARGATSLVRWAFCKQPEVIDEAVARLAKLGG